MKNKKVGLGIGAGLIATGAAAAGYYFYASKNAKTHRKIAASWAANLKKDVEANIRAGGPVSKAAFMKVIDRAAKLYSGAREASTEEIQRAAKELKGNYATFKKEMGVIKKVVKKKSRPAKK